MTSEPRAPKEAFAWIHLPGEVRPVVAGRITVSGSVISFNYGKSYLEREDAIPLYEPELPLRPGLIAPLMGLSIPGCIRDAAPDAWGRRVLMNRLLGRQGQGLDPIELDELTYLLESGSDRIGALDFQRSPTEYVPRATKAATLDELLESAKRVEDGVLLHPDLDAALCHGTSIGGARPKALVDDEDRKYVAKFSSTTDTRDVVRSEFVAMRLAAACGLDVAPVSLTRASGKDVLLIERFDRQRTSAGFERRSMVSALTMLSLDEMMARHASYEDLAELVRHRFVEPRRTLHELFGRLVFNILCGNTDDHARNHAAFWNGTELELTPAYDVCPQNRSGNQASQAMLIHGNDRASQLGVCIRSAPAFHLSPDQAIGLIDQQLATVHEGFEDVCEEAELAEVNRKMLWGRQVLNPFIFEGLPEGAHHLSGYGVRDQPHLMGR